jgi:hypothetical protein
MKARIVLASFLVLCLAAPSLPIRAFPQAQSSQQAQRLKQIEKAKKISKIIGQVRRLLLEARVPFEPVTLFTRHWRQRLSPVFEAMPEMKINKQQFDDLKGVHLADTLYLPDQVKLAGDTVIVAKRVIFQGREVLIKGPYSVHIFAVDSVKTESTGGTITIDTSGRGKKEWLRSLENKQSQ